jgi:hypothetical protein
MTKNWHKGCFRSVPLFDPEAVPSPRPGAHFAAARRRRQGRPSREPCHKLLRFQAGLDGGEHGGTLAPVGVKTNRDRLLAAAPSRSCASPRLGSQFRFPCSLQRTGKCQREVRQIARYPTFKVRDPAYSVDRNNRRRHRRSPQASVSNGRRRPIDHIGYRSSLRRLRSTNSQHWRRWRQSRWKRLRVLR